MAFRVARLRLVRDPHLLSEQSYIPDRAFGVRSVPIAPTAYQMDVGIAVPKENALAGLLRPGLSVEVSVDTRAAGTGSTLAGAIFGALFLRRFVTTGTPWAHFDLYAWNPRERPGRPVGGEAHCLRMAHRLISERFG